MPLEHDTDSVDCWCEPAIVQACPECASAPEKPDPGCWHCGGRGVVPVYDPEGDVIVIHRGGK